MTQDEITQCEVWVQAFAGRKFGWSFGNGNVKPYCTPVGYYVEMNRFYVLMRFHDKLLLEHSAACRSLVTLDVGKHATLLKSVFASDVDLFMDDFQIIMPALKLIEESPPNRYPLSCPKCKKPAYVGVVPVDVACSNFGCKHFRD